MEASESLAASRGKSGKQQDERTPRNIPSQRKMELNDLLISVSL